MLSIKNCTTSPIKFKQLQKATLTTKTPKISRSKNHEKLKPCQVISGIRLPGLLTSPTPILDKDEALSNLDDNISHKARKEFRAFYSSEYEGIVTDPLLMSIPIDDRIITRGHCAYDICYMYQGYLYLFDEHFKRFKMSIHKAGLELPIDDYELKKVILHTAAASSKLNGYIRFWATAGRSGYLTDVSPRSGKGCSLYVLASGEKDYQKYDITKGWSIKTSPVPANDAYFTSFLSNSYLPAALAKMDAESDGYDIGVLVDADDNVVSAGNYGIGIITKDEELIIPPAVEAVGSTTMNRIIKLISETKLDTKRLTVKKIMHRTFTVREAKMAKEVFVTSALLPVMSIIKWDLVYINDGTPGENTLGFNQLIIEDACPRENSFVHTEVPYGVTTGMQGEESDRTRPREYNTLE